MFSYWVEIAMFSLDLATTWWPIPTVILAVLVIIVKAFQDNWKSLSEWASSVGIALTIFIVGLLVFYAPYAHNAKLKETIALARTELETLRTEKNSFDKTIEELTTERDRATNEKKLFEEARDILQKQLDDRNLIAAEQKDKMTAELAKSCFNQRVRFTEKRRTDRAYTRTDKLYDKQVELRPGLSLSETATVRVYADGNFSSEIESPDIAQVMAVGSGMVELRLRPSHGPKDSFSFTLSSAAPFNVLCVDKLPVTGN